MGVEYRAVVLVGVPWGDIPEEMQDRDRIEDVGFDRISPYYDADIKDCLVGIVVCQTGDYNYTQLDLDRLEVAKAFKSVKEQLGVEGKLYLSPHGR